MLKSWADDATVNLFFCLYSKIKILQNTKSLFQKQKWEDVLQTDKPGDLPNKFFQDFHVKGFDRSPKKC
jgi:hypothetical protein